MNKIMCGLFLSLYALMAQAEVLVRIDSSPISINQTFQLTLTQEGAKQQGLPDLSVLKKDFMILGTERHMSYTLINGQSNASSQWTVTLKPLKTGVLSIPAIQMGSEHSNAMTINVEGTTTNQATPDLDQHDLMLKTSLDQDKPYVNQEVIYTVKLFNSKRLLDANYEAPQVTDALMIPLGETKRYQTVQNNTNYVVEEQQYAVFPQKSGTLTINSPSFTAMVYDVDPQRVTVQDKASVVTVQPIPKAYQGSLWLPAKQVNLSEQYEHSNQTLSQGSTLVRTITLEGLGLPAQLLPALEFKNKEGYNVYTEKGTDKNQVRQGELVGTTDFKVTYLFNKPGTIIIPEVRLHWFNTQTGKDEVAVLAPRSIEVTPSANAQNTSANTPQSKDNVAEEHQNDSVPAQPAATGTIAQENNTWVWVLALFFASAWLITLGLWGWQKRSRCAGRGAYKVALEQLKRACTSSNPKDARDALIKWASLHWPDASLLNLADLTQLIRDPQLKKQVHLLSQALYKNQDKALWRGDELLRAVYAIKKTKSGDKKSKAVLPPINPF
jgi:hypothetical protein